MVQKIMKDIMLWGQKKATKKDLENFIKEEQIDDFINNDSDDDDDKKIIKSNVKVIKKKKTEFIDGEDYDIEDIDMLESEYDKNENIISKLYNDGNDDEAEELEDKQEKIANLIEGLKALKKMSGKGFKKGSVEAKEHAKKMAEARKAKAKPKVEKPKKEKKVRGKPYYFINTPPKGYREATEEEAIKAGKVGVLGKYQVDNVRYDMYLKFKILLSDKNDEGDVKSNQILISNMNGLKTRIDKLLKKLEVENTKKENKKYNEYDDLKNELSMVNKAYNWYNKLYSNKNNIPYVSKKFKIEKPSVKLSKSKELKPYKKVYPIDPRTGKPSNVEIYEDDDEYIFESDGKEFKLKKSYFQDDEIIIKDKYAIKLFKKGFILLPEYYTEKTKKKLFGKILGGSIFSLDNLKKAFTGFTPLTALGNTSALSLINNLDDNVGGYPRYVEDIIKKYGNNNIIKIEVGRTPIQSAIDGLMNVLMLGKLEKRKERKGYDDLFHLRLIAYLDNGKRITIEKNERINMAVNEKKRSNEEKAIVEGDFTDLTINDLLEGAQRIQGDKYFKYSASTNNCQDFVLALLQGSNIGDIEDFDFVKQDVKSLFAKYGYMKKIQDKVTNLAGKFNQLVYGGNIEGGRISMAKVGDPFRKAIAKSGISGFVDKAVGKSGIKGAYSGLNTNLGRAIDASNKKTIIPVMKSLKNSDLNLIKNKQFNKLGRDAGDLTWHYLLPAAVTAGKHLYDGVAATASTMLTGNPYAGKKTADYLWQTMVADEGNDLRKNQKSKTLGIIADEAGKAGAKTLTGNMTGSGGKRKRGRPRKVKKPIEVVVKTPLDYELFTHSNNASLKQLLESKRRKQEGNLSKNVNLMANYIKNDVANVKKEIEQLKNEREFYKGASGAGIKKTSNWIQHCKDYAKKHNVSYKQAMKDAKASYKK